MSAPLLVAPYRGQAAVDRANAISGDDYRGLCLQFVRTCFGIPGKCASAHDAWFTSQLRHPGDPENAPAGYPIFWDITSGSNAPYDHVAISLGGGMCRSTSVTSAGIGNIGIVALGKKWGMTPYGWTEDINGYSVAYDTFNTDSEDDEMGMTEEQAATLATVDANVKLLMEWMQIGGSGSGDPTYLWQIRQDTAELLKRNPKG